MRKYHYYEFCSTPLKQDFINNLIYKLTTIFIDLAVKYFKDLICALTDLYTVKTSHMSQGNPEKFLCNTVHSQLNYDV